MIPIQQTKFHSSSQKGNCLAACVASLLDLTLAEVPQFENFNSGVWHDKLIDFLKVRGYELIRFDDYSDLSFYFTPQGIENLYYIANGQSPRDLSINHSVIYKQDQLVFDPHPSNSGILSEYFFFAVRQRN